MNKFLYFISIVCISVSLASCQTTDSIVVEDLENNTQPELTLSLEEKENINDFCSQWNQLNSMLEKVSKECETRAGNEQDPLYTEEDIEAINTAVSNVGDAAQKMFVSMGMSQVEMNSICPTEQSLVYAVAGLEVVNAIDDPTINILGPQGYEVMAFDKEKALHCLGQIFYIDIVAITTDLTIATKSGQSVTKEMIIKTVEKAIRKTATKLAAYTTTGAIGVAALLVEWSLCYFS
ncbi:MAG: hypothetical protein IJS97_06465 [Prevotella sp.]|nr:hypothetical protein [Prevotella sp.]